MWCQQGVRRSKACAFSLLVPHSPHFQIFLGWEKKDNESCHLWHFPGIKCPLYFKYSAAASFVRPPSIEFFEDLPWDFSSEFPSFSHPSAFVPDNSTPTISCWVLLSHQVAAFLTMTINYLSYLSLVSLVLVWNKRLVYLQLGKTWNHLPVGSLGPSFSYKAWWRGDITEDSLAKIVFRETALMLSSHLVYIHWLTLVFVDSCGDDESFYWLFLEYL